MALHGLVWAPYVGVYIEQREKQKTIAIALHCHYRPCCIMLILYPLLLYQGRQWELLYLHGITIIIIRTPNYTGRPPSCYFSDVDTLPVQSCWVLPGLENDSCLSGPVQPLRLVVVVCVIISSLPSVRLSPEGSHLLSYLCICIACYRTCMHIIAVISVTREVLAL